MVAGIQLEINFIEEKNAIIGRFDGTRKKHREEFLMLKFFNVFLIFDTQSYRR